MHLEDMIRMQLQGTEREKLVTYPGGSVGLLAVRNVGLVWVVGVTQQGARGCHATAPRRAGLARLGVTFLLALIICCGGLASLGVTQ